MDTSRRLPARTLVAGCVAASAIALVVPPLVAMQGDAEKAVLQAIAQVNDAFRRRDVKAYDALTTTDFVRVGENGRVSAKSEWLKRSVAAPGPERRAGTFDEASVRIYGNAALVTYRNKPLTPDGTPGTVSYLTRVMTRQAGQWKMAFAQGTSVTAPAAPTGPEPAALPALAAPTAVEKEARAAFDAIQKANAARDVAVWERLSAPDHLIVNTDGRKVTRAERVAALKAPPAANAPAPGAQSDVRLSVKGGTLAVVTWKAGQSRSVKVLAKQGGAWQQVLQQSSPIIAPTS